jgi:hypothetical protein
MSFDGTRARAAVHCDRRIFRHALPLYWGTQAQLRRRWRWGQASGCSTSAAAPVCGRRSFQRLPQRERRWRLRFARTRFAGGRWHFAAMRADALGLRPGSFDKALIANVVHHLTEAELDALLCSVRAVVRGPVVLLDVALEIANPLERLPLRYDRREYVRPLAALRPLIARGYAIEREETHNTLHIIPQVLFHLATGDTQ